MLDKKTIREFMSELASNSPAPGGGSVSAVAASLSASLVSMVCNLTIGKKSYEALSEEEKLQVDNSLKVCDVVKDEFLDLMNEDTEVFLELMKAFKMPKESDEEKKARSAKIQLGYKGSLEVPLKTAKKTFSLYDYILAVAKYGNKNAVSDAGVAALMAQSGLESAILNVKINVTSIKDEEYVKNVKAEIEHLVNDGRARRDEILAIVESKL
ncbi:cyclodeaminase/cyclohydrolase family protein [Clostridium sp. ATCC 25772]|uniref:cyclodeaminase/cyclohydrolase family protein n=1 Tax=Clostridium sp. ATCC 25772 TaxID=1676991 RepID=UPI00078386BC|nr:cyclodeaminase/cyclohydrolase family protein [Clostridium sp. ATCC 25772]